MDDGLTRVERQPAVEPARLPTLRLPCRAAPARRMRLRLLRPPAAGLVRPPAAALGSRRPRRIQVAPGADRRRIDLERRQRHALRRQFVVEGEAASAGRPADRHLGGRQVERVARRQRRQCQPRPAPGSPGPRASRRRLRRACLRGTARADGSTGRLVILVGARQRVQAGVELGVEPRRQFMARGQGRAPACGMGQARRIEQGVRAGDARRQRRMHRPASSTRCGPRSDPELGEPCQMRKLPGDRVDAPLRGGTSTAHRRGRRSRRACAPGCAQGGRQRLAGQRARRRVMSAGLSAPLPECLDAQAACPDRVARAGGCQQRQLADRLALGPLPGAAGRGRDRRELGRRAPSTP